MKSKALLALFLLIMVVPACAQNKSYFKFGAAAVYASRINQPGYRISASYVVKDIIEIRCAFNNYFFDTQDDSDVSLIGWYLDFPLYLFSSGNTTFYTMGGASYMEVTETFSDRQSKNSNFAAAIGIGAFFISRKKLNPYFELKYHAFYFDHMECALGLTIRL